MRAAGVALAAGALCAAARVQAEPSGVVFRWSRDASASTCASGDAMAEDIARRLGAMPFAREGQRSLEGFVERREGAYRVRLVLRDAGGAIAWTRELTSRDAECTAATQGAALAVVALLAPEVEAARGETDAGIDAAEAAPPDVSIVSDAAPRSRVDAGAPEPVPPSPRPSLEGAAAPTTFELHAAIGSALLPSPSGGVDLGASRGLHGPFRLELGALWLSSVRTESRRFAFGLAAARAAVCAEHTSTQASFGLCAGAFVGVVHGTVYEISPSEPGDRAWIAGALGPRARVHVAGPLLLSAGGNVLVNALRYQFVNAVGGRDFVIFEQPILGIEGHIGLALAFP